MPGSGGAHDAQTMQPQDWIALFLGLLSLVGLIFSIQYATFAISRARRIAIYPESVRANTSDVTVRARELSRIAAHVDRKATSARLAAEVDQRVRDLDHCVRRIEYIRQQEGVSANAYAPRWLDLLDFRKLVRQETRRVVIDADHAVKTGVCQSELAALIAAKQLNEDLMVDAAGPARDRPGAAGSSRSKGASGSDLRRRIVRQTFEFSLESVQTTIAFLPQGFAGSMLDVAMHIQVAGYFLVLAFRCFARLAVLREWFSMRKLTDAF